MNDALAAWLETRDALLEPALLERARTAPLVWAKRDGHRRFIDEHDVPREQREPDRAKRLRTALRATRERAEERPSLDVAALVALASIALGARPDLRTGPAHGKGGAEVYGVALLPRFPHALAEIDDTSVPLIVRAARVYLDVCFFHPLADGNARAARLALDFVLSRGGVRFDLVAPLFLVPRPAGDPRSHQALVRTMSTLAEATARRASAPQLHSQDDQREQETAP